MKKLITTRQIEKEFETNGNCAIISFNNEDGENICYIINDISHFDTILSFVRKYFNDFKIVSVDDAISYVCPLWDRDFHFEVIDSNNITQY